MAWLVQVQAAKGIEAGWNVGSDSEQRSILIFTIWAFLLHLRSVLVCTDGKYCFTDPQATVGNFPSSSRAHPHHHVDHDGMPAVGLFLVAPLADRSSWAKREGYPWLVTEHGE